MTEHCSSNECPNCLANATATYTQNAPASKIDDIEHLAQFIEHNAYIWASDYVGMNEVNYRPAAQQWTVCTP